MLLLTTTGRNSGAKRTTPLIYQRHGDDYPTIRSWPCRSRWRGSPRETLAGPARHDETVLVAELDLTDVLSARRLFDPVGHYHRPDLFRLAVDTAPRPVVTEMRNGLDGE